MNESKYNLLNHLLTSILAGFLFSLGVGLIFGIKMIGINESTHQFRLAYPFLLNFVPMYLLLGVIFGAAVGLLGTLLFRKNGAQRGFGFPAALGMSFLAFLALFIIFRAPLGPIAGMFLGLLVFTAASSHRPPLSRLYFAVFLTAIAFNYSWQWVRQHFIINPLMPIDQAKTLDFIFTLIWALIFLLGFRLFIKALLRTPIRAVYITGVSVVVLILALGGLYYFAGPKPVSAVAAQPPEITRRPVDVKVAVIGVDGLWWKIIDELFAKDELPTIKRLRENGTSGNLGTLYPTFSAAIWSSISTGKSTEKHGVTSFLIWKFPWTGFTLPCFITPKITAEMDWMRKSLIITAPMNNQFLESAPIWEMLSDHGANVGMVNWWLSYPAYPLNGFNVTDHCLYNKEYVMENFKTREGDTPYDLYPMDLMSEIKSFSRSPESLSDEEICRFITVADSDRAFLKEFRDIDTYDYLDIAYEASMFKYSYPEDATFAAATRYLLAEHQPEVLCVYLDGMDSMQHQYLKYYFADEHRDKLIPRNAVRYRHLIENYYQYIDETLASFIAAADSNTIFMIISDHGFDAEIMPTGHYNHMNAPPGVFLCAGPGIKAGYRIENAHVYDIAPTILHLMGLPVAADFDGKALTDIMLDPGTVETIPTYDAGRRASHQVIQSDMDEAYKDKLKALGYTQ
jgi:predicted AlkP superfamily pyrophosphatase or phosphodiesterase